MKKADMLARWRALPQNAPIMPHMTPIPYKSTGSSYGSCGIRIDGNQQFIDAVLSRIKDMIDGENHVTRLELACNPVDGSKLGKKFEKAEQDAQVCYIRLHQRGREGSIASGILNRDLDDATARMFEE